VHVSSVLSTFHYDSPAAFSFQRGVVKGRVDATHDSVSTDADTHLPANHESDATEHSLFLNIDGASKSNSHAVYQIIVRWHRVLLPWCFGNA
jgi:hypothetical protein